ncbi:MAG: class I SAM-dependent methyltransferase [Planctomycetes bacterium]|nr:class I SAM-dependent methyltransferase [Planctomycetota bacterium]
MTLIYKDDGSIDYHATYTHTHNKHESYKKNNWGIIYRMYWDKLISQDSSILEIGCGNGYLCKRLNIEGYNVVGMDVVADQRGGIFPYKRHDITETPWPFQDKQFDVGLAFDVFEHIAEDQLEAVLSEFVRVSKSQAASIPHLKSVGKLHVTVKPVEWWLERLTLVSDNNWKVAKTIIKEKGAGAGKPTSIILRQSE